MAYLQEQFSPHFMVYTLPEVAATTIGSGVNIIPSEFTPETHKIFTVSLPFFWKFLRFYELLAIKLKSKRKYV